MNSHGSVSPASALAARVGRREVLLGALGAGAAGVAALRTPTATAAPPPAGELAALLPQHPAGWRSAPSTGVVLPAPDALRDRLYDQLVTRLYHAPGEPAVMLLLAYKAAQDGVVQLHRPEVCYPASGFALDRAEPLELPLTGTTVPCLALTASRAGRIEHLLYFTRIGAAFPRSWAEQRWAVLAANLHGAVPDGLLLRISAIGPDRAAALGTLGRFLPALATAGSPAFRRLLTGAAS